MKRADELIPWKVTDISFRPYKGMWSMNPSIHFDGQIWRCVLRCADYCMLGGKTTRSDRAMPGESRTKSAMVIFDPSRWKPVEIYKMRERDDLPRVPCPSVGYKGGLQGIAASLHLRRDDRSQKPLAEQVLLTFDAEYDIVDPRPIRGDSWNGSPQPRFLYSIVRGTLFDDRGAVRDGDAMVWPSLRPRRSYEPDRSARKRSADRAQEAEHARARERERNKRSEWKTHTGEPSRSTQPSNYEALRGGTQLVRVGDNAWLGIGHEMKFVNAKKLYWHVWYLVDSRGKMKSASPSMKLAPYGIEFAAGMAIDGDRVVVSFGVDDMKCTLGETKLPAVLEILQPVGR